MLNKNTNKILFNNYQKKGWVIVKNFFLKKEIKYIKKQILYKIKNKKKFNFNFYYELINKRKRLRRIERVSDFSEKAKQIINSKKVIYLIKLLKKNKYNLFKDKLNFKYPGGKGYLPHIDGHFLWRDKNNIKQFGWKKYSEDFINLVIPLEETNVQNGCVYVSNINNTKKLGRNFNEIANKLDVGTPNIKKKYIKKFKFNKIELEEGDICLFDWKCAHFSKDNTSKFSRMIFYATYYKKNKNKNIRNLYYKDKLESLNDKNNKSLLF